MPLLQTTLPDTVCLRFGPTESVPSHLPWIDTDIAVTQWRWLREHADRQITHGVAWPSWLLGFLGSRDAMAPAAHSAALGIVQGIDMALVPGSRQYMLPGMDPADAVNLAMAVREAAAAAEDLSSVPMNAAQKWVNNYPHRIPGATGLAAAWEILRQDPLLAGGLSSMLDRTRPDQYFAGAAPRIWCEGVRRFPWLLMSCGIGQQDEGTAVPHTTDCARAFKKAKAAKWSLRAFLDHAHNQGRAAGCRSKEIGMALSCDTERGSRENAAAVSEFFLETVGPLQKKADADHLLRCLDMSLRRYQHPMFGALDAGAVSVLAFLSYDYCWWRGAVEGLAQTRGR